MLEQTGVVEFDFFSMMPKDACVVSSDGICLNY